MKEMIERLIADGWKWVAKNYGFTSVLLFKRKPCVELSSGGSFFETNVECITIPECLFPQINNKNSPVELKTLLVDDEGGEGEHHKIVQREIASLLEKNYSFLIRDFEEDVIAVTEDGKRVEYNVSCFLSKLCPTKYEKVYLKDLLKKSKVKKSVWVTVDIDSLVSFSTEKPKRGKRSWIRDESFIAVRYDSIVTNHIGLTWEDEPLELTYEVEE